MFLLLGQELKFNILIWIRNGVNVLFYLIPKNAGFIHVRTKIKPEGPKQDKILNFQYLVDEGVLVSYRRDSDA